jgi:uncharacterized membrane protein YoaK (UPF0700 family)
LVTGILPIIGITKEIELSGVFLYVVIGVAIIAIMIGIMAVVLMRRTPNRVERNSAYSMLTLGIIFLIPGLITLILDGEPTVFLSLGIIFTLSGLAARFLIKAPDDPEVRRLTLIGSLIGFTVGGASGAVISLVFDLPEIPLIILLGAIGLLTGMVLGRIYRHRCQA